MIFHSFHGHIFIYIYLYRHEYLISLIVLFWLFMFFLPVETVKNSILCSSDRSFEHWTPACLYIQSMSFEWQAKKTWQNSKSICLCFDNKTINQINTYTLYTLNPSHWSTDWETKKRREKKVNSWKMTTIPLNSCNDECIFRTLIYCHISLSPIEYTCEWEQNGNIENTRTFLNDHCSYK